MEPRPDCVFLGAVVLHGGEGVEGVEDVKHGDGLARPVAGSRVAFSLANSGLTFVVATAAPIVLQLLFPCREKVTNVLDPLGVLLWTFLVFGVLALSLPF